MPFLLSIFLIAAPVSASAFEAVLTRDAFVTLVQDRALTRMGIALDVSGGGVIEGRAFGRPVTGDWEWRDRYFCRTLYFGQRDLGANCQTVEVRGDTLRFTLDQGRGDFADLTLR